MLCHFCLSAISTNFIFSMQHSVLHYDDSLEDNQVRQTRSDANPVNLSFCQWPLTDTF